METCLLAWPSVREVVLHLCLQGFFECCAPNMCVLWRKVMIKSISFSLISSKRGCSAYLLINQCHKTLVLVWVITFWCNLYQFHYRAWINCSLCVGSNFCCTLPSLILSVPHIEPVKPAVLACHVLFWNICRGRILHSYIYCYEVQQL